MPSQVQLNPFFEEELANFNPGQLWEMPGDPMAGGGTPSNISGPPGITNPLAPPPPQQQMGGFAPGVPQQVPGQAPQMPSQLEQMLNSPGAAMASAAMGNLSQRSLGNYGQMSDPIQVYQQTVNNRAIMAQREKTLKMQEEQQAAATESARQKNALELYQLMNPKDSAGKEKLKLYMSSLGLDPEDPAAIQDPRISEFLSSSGGVKVDINNNPTPPNILAEPAGMDSKAAQDAFRDNLVSLPNLLNIGAGFKPEFLSSIGQTKQEWNAFRDRTSGGTALTPQDKKTLTEYTQFQNQVEQYFNAYKKAITGSAGSEQELEGIRKSIFNMDQGPTAFQASLENLQNQMARDLRGSIYLQSQGKAAMGTPQMEKELAKRGAADFTSDKYFEAVSDYLMDTLGYDEETWTQEQKREIHEHMKRLGF